MPCCWQFFRKTRARNRTHVRKVLPGACISLTKKPPEGGLLWEGWEGGFTSTLRLRAEPQLYPFFSSGTDLRSLTSPCEVSLR